MSLNFLDFEQPIAELEAKIDSLTAVSRQDEKLDINIDEEVHRLREKSVEGGPFLSPRFEQAMIKEGFSRRNT